VRTVTVGASGLAGALLLLNTVLVCCRHSWPEAARVLQKAVEESKKLKRRGTPNVIVFAGMTLPQPFQFPIFMSKRHVQFLHQLTESFKGMTSAIAMDKADSSALLMCMRLCRCVPQRGPIQLRRPHVSRCERSSEWLPLPLRRCAQSHGTCFLSCRCHGQSRHDA
jgi:hypothetical protein